MDRRSVVSYLRRAGAILLLAALAFLPAAPAALAAGRTVRAGDIDGDGAVSASDARLALRIAVELSVAAAEILPYADVTGDGGVTAGDARLILRAAVGLEDEKTFASFYAGSPYQGTEIPYRNKSRMGELILTEKERVPAPQDFVRREGSQYVWTSSNPAVAEVSENGTITAKARGSACVYLTAGANRYYYSVTVRTALQQKIYALAEKYPHGYFWNAHEKSKEYPAVSEIPCSDHATGRYQYCIGQCAGFALLMSNEVFGSNAPLYKIGSVDEIKIGDDVRCLPHHSVFVTDRVEKGEICGYDIYYDRNLTADAARITIVECNWDCRCGIAWGRTIALDSLRIEPAYSYSRYR